MTGVVENTSGLSVMRLQGYDFIRDDEIRKETGPEIYIPLIREDSNRFVT